MQLAQRFGQPIMDPEPFLAADDQPTSPQVCQMAGDRGLRQFEGFMQVADADLAIREQVQQPEPHRVGERLEEFDGFIQRVGSLLLYPHSQI